MIEKLESRRLLTALLTDGVLSIEGTPDSDRVVLSVSENELTVDDGVSPAVFLANAVTRVVARLYGGPDLLDLGDIAVPTTIYAGVGNDTIIGGYGADAIHAGRGADVLAGKQGSDTLFGGNGFDELRAGKGRDRAIGGDGDDRLYGGRGADLLTDASGKDRFFAIDGTVRDTLLGGTGVDAVECDEIGDTGDIVDVTTPEVLITPTVGVQYEGTLALLSSRYTLRNASEYSVTVDWGDGSISTGIVYKCDMGMLGVDASHTYAEVGQYQLVLTVTHGDTTQTLLRTAMVDTVPPTDSYIYHTYEVGKERSAAVGVFRRVAGDAPEDYTATIDWGDGQQSAGEITTEVLPASEQVYVSGDALIVRGAHAYQDVGWYSIRVTLQGHGRVVQFLANAGADVINAIQLRAQTLTVPVGTRVKDMVAKIDGPQGYGPDESITIEWGDGDVSHTDNAGAGDCRVYHDGIISDHTYTTTGTYSVTVTMDRLGHVSAVTSTIHVVDALTATNFMEDVHSDENGRELQVNEPFTALLARFVPVHPDDAPFDYSAAMAWESNVVPSSGGIAIAKNADGLMEVRGTHTYIGTGWGLRLLISGHGKMADLSGSATVNCELDVNVTPIDITTSRYQEFSGVIATFTSDDPTLTEEDFTACGGASDGNYQLRIASNSSGGFDVLLTHTFTSSQHARLNIDHGDRRASFDVVITVV